MFKRRKPEEPPPEAAKPAMPAAIVPIQGTSAQGTSTQGTSTQGTPTLATNAPRPADSGLGVPPFRPAPPKESLPMSRPPFPAAPQIPPQLPNATPGGQQAVQQQRPAGNRPPAERRTMVIGRGISVHGTIQDAERLEVQGIVEAKMIHATELAIAQGGMFRGEIEVEEAEIAGTIDGILTARNSLIVRSTGRVLGTARCRRLQVEDGGQITGQIEMITEARSAESASPAETPRPADTTA